MNSWILNPHSPLCTQDRFYMNKKDETLKTYNTSAILMSEKFNKSGTRVNDIKDVFSIVDISNPNVLEIGCGNGRDAAEIVKHTNRYLGIDYSSGLIEIAKKNNPDIDFLIADVELCTLPKKLDIVFAFASLLHTPIDILENIFNKVYLSLNTGGVFRVSLKESDKYQELTVDEVCGKRTFYLYSKGDILSICNNFKVEAIRSDYVNNQNWIEITLRKI